MVEVLSKDELKELGELGSKVTQVQYIDAVVKVLNRMKAGGFFTTRLYTGTDLLMMAGRDLVKELRNELEGAHH